MVTGEGEGRAEEAELVEWLDELATEDKEGPGFGSGFAVLGGGGGGRLLELEGVVVVVVVEGLDSLFLEELFLLSWKRGENGKRKRWTRKGYQGFLEPLHNCYRGRGEKRERNTAEN